MNMFVDMSSRSEAARPFPTVPPMIGKVVGEVMRPTPTIEEHDSLERVHDVVLASGLSAIPVIDDGGRVSGLLLTRDLYRGTFGYKSGRWSVARAARRSGIVVGRDWPVGEVAMNLELEGLPAVAVVDADGRPIGICERSDLLEAMRASRRWGAEEWRQAG
jgi:CBS domain-containing protein